MLAHQKQLYKLVDQKGGGDLIEWAKNGLKENSFSFLDGFIVAKVGVAYSIKHFNVTGRRIPPQRPWKGLFALWMEPSGIRMWGPCP